MTHVLSECQRQSLCRSLFLGYDLLVLSSHAVRRPPAKSRCTTVCAEMDMVPFYLTHSNPTHQLAVKTNLNQLIEKWKNQPNPFKPLWCTQQIDIPPLRSKLIATQQNQQTNLFRWNNYVTFLRIVEKPKFSDYYLCTTYHTQPNPAHHKVNNSTQPDPCIGPIVNTHLLACGSKWLYEPFG